MPKNTPSYRREYTIASENYFGKKETTDAPFNERQSEFFQILPERLLKIDFAKIVALPEYTACKPAFIEGAHLFFSSEEQESNAFVHQWLRVFFEKSIVTMWRSSMYGTEPAAQTLAALARRLGFPAYVKQPYGDHEMDFAVVVDCTCC